jgi:UDP-N-acetylmuramoyl-tripeptide--D-alanyl-D-alanine ligase
MRLGALAAAVGGSHPGGSASSTVTCVVTDSRQAAPGVLFFALRGERTDGHLFVDRVLDAGGFAVVSQGSPREGVIVVEHVERALTEAASWRRKLMSSTVIGISGSSGKTTTRVLLCSALGGSRSVHGTSGNLNNQIGLPVTILNTPEPDPDLVVLEMGMNHTGELADLCRTARPDHCLVTNIGTAHMEFFGSRDGIARAKAELLAGTAPGGFCVIPAGEPILAEQARRTGLALRTAGPGGDAWAEPAPSGCLLHPWGMRLALSLPGSHHCGNAAAVMLMADLLGASLPEAAKAMEAVQPMRGRGRTVRSEGITILDESYNANPDSTAACLDALADSGGPRGAVLGDMRELGADSRAYHRAILELADGLGLTFLILVGEMYASVLEPGRRTRMITAEDWREALDLLRAEAPAGSTVLVKGSNSLKLDELVRAMEGDP